VRDEDREGPELLRQLTIRNFKAFGEMQVVPLAPITLIFGSNSAGKSSIIQALLLMRQSVGAIDARPGDRPSELIIRGEFADLGSFDALLHRHERDRELEIGWTTARRQFRDGQIPEISAAVRYQRPGTADEIGLIGSSIGRPGHEVGFEKYEFPADADLRAFPGREERSSGEGLIASRDGTRALLASAYANETMAPVLRRRRLTTQRESLPSLEMLDELLVRRAARVVATSSAGLPIEAVGFETSSGFLAPRRRSTGDSEQPENEVALFETLTLVEAEMRSSARLAELSIGQVEHLGPMREAPGRIHVLSGERLRGSGNRGQHVVDLLARQPSLLERANEWFERLEIPYVLDVRAVSDRSVAGAIGEVHCLLLKDRATGVEVAPTDVGFGIGQVLPVVVESIIGRGTLCIEQPEIHLHPALQARLAELFADRVKDGRQQFILETHSEHLILRLQRLVRRGQLTPEDISVLHVGPGADGAGQVRHLRLRSDGSLLDEWPGGFFDERFEELFED
jgi:hypothetical protein